MTRPCVMIVERDVLVRAPLADYLRECGFRVLEASTDAEARLMVGAWAAEIGAALIDIDGSAEAAFALAAWLRSEHPAIAVAIAGTPARAAEKAGNLCAEGAEGADVSKPYDHRVVLDRIRRLMAARDRGKTPG